LIDAGLFIKKGSCEGVAADAQKLLLSAFDLRSQVVLGVALHDVLYQRAVIWQKVGGDVDSLSVPDFAVLETVLSRVQYRQKTELCANTEI
jgi:hypothetical protein